MIIISLHSPYVSNLEQDPYQTHLDIGRIFSPDSRTVSRHSLSLRYLVTGRHKLSPYSEILHIHSGIGSRLSTDPSSPPL